jgi:ABC-type enterobactin transport system permease subunit
MAQSNGGIVGGSAAGGATVGVAATNILNWYLATPDVIQTDVVIVGTFMLASLGAIVSHLLTRVDLDHDGKPDIVIAP